MDILMTGALMLPPIFKPMVARAAEQFSRVPVVWLHFAECTGCSEAFLRTSYPNVDDILLDTISLEYHETLMAAAGEAFAPNNCRFNLAYRDHRTAVGMLHALHTRPDRPLQPSLRLEVAWPPLRQIRQRVPDFPRNLPAHDLSADSGMNAVKSA